MMRLKSRRDLVEPMNKIMCGFVLPFKAHVKLSVEDLFCLSDT